MAPPTKPQPKTLTALLRQRMRRLMASDILLVAGMRVFATILGVFILLSSLIYGASVYYERVICMEGREAREIEEENMALRVQLDKLQAYQSVSKISARSVHLKPASDPITIMASAPLKTPELEPEKPIVSPYSYGY